MSSYAQARAWLDRQDAAIAGQDGHGQTYHVACVLSQGFGLAEPDVLGLLLEYNSRCQPQWSERELVHKTREAAQAIPGDGKQRGYMLKNGPGRDGTRPRHTPKATPAPQSERKPVDIEGVILPDPIPDGTRELIRACFAPGEGIRIAHATLSEDGRELPANEGPCLSREEWLRKLDKAGGDPNKIWHSSRRTGIYITINPLRIGGAKDSDVTAFRHALVEFDSISREEQWTLYQQSKLPCAAIISSGGKSIHAWVKVDARDRTEYDERVRIIYDHFAQSGYDVDAKNKNPSRFSRLPNCVRFSARQELLALDVGHASYTEWIKEQQNADLGDCRSTLDLMDGDRFNADKDGNCVIGFRDGRTLRYLCKGKSAWLIGPSGIGKSSLLAQFAIGWAQGQPVFGITPAKPLKSLIVQAENDEHDLAEMVQGVCSGQGLDFADEALRSSVGQNVRFWTDTTVIGSAFTDKLQRLIDREKPDIVWCDPLLSFAGIDVAKQEQATHFLRQLLQPVLNSTGAVLIGAHHTGKPRDTKQTSAWSTIDWAYSGIGSSELVNWARAVMVLYPHGEGKFELKLAKRGNRAGATHPDGSWAYSSIWLQHAKGAIRWEQIDPPSVEQPPPKSKEPKQSKVEQLAAKNLHEVLSKIPDEGESALSLGERFAKFSRKVGKTLGLTKCRSDLLDLLIDRGMLVVDTDSALYKKGPNA